MAVDKFAGMTEEEIIQSEVTRIIRAEKVVKAWSSEHIESTPSEKQLEPFLYLASRYKYLYLLGGNQSIPKGNFISMADETERCISQVKVGDLVKVFDTKLEKLVDAPVIKHWNNGIKPVYRWHFKYHMLESTEKHEMLQIDDYNKFYKEMLNKVEYCLIPDEYYTHGVWAESFLEKESLGNLQVFDLTVDHPDHNYICNGIIVGNSGKSNGIVRNVVWMVEESSPYWRRPSDHICNNKLCNTPGNLRSNTTVVLDYECPKCGNIWRVWDKKEAITIMVVGQQLKNLQENLYVPRIKKLFQYPEEWKEDKLGSPYIQKVTNIKTGNTLIFFPHGHGEERARSIVQGYTVHAVFTDEQLPSSVAEELQRRVDAKMGTFFSGFTMKTVDTDYLRMIDAQVASGAAKSFKISKLDNPIYEGSKDIIMRQLAGLTEAKRNAVLYGEVSYGDEYIFSPLNREDVMKAIPAEYSKSWRHVEILDPAIKSKAGRLVMAQDPKTKIWHAITAQYLQGMLYDAHLYEAHLRLREKEGYKPILSVADDDAGFIGMARHHANPTKFIYPPSKRSKKGGKLFLIKQTVGVLLAGGIHFDPKFTLLWDEINSYRWKDQSKAEVVNSHKYHILDCIMYFIDTLPDEEKVPEARKTYEQEIIEANLFGFTPSPKLLRKQGLPTKRKAYIMSSRLRSGTMK